MPYAEALSLGIMVVLLTYFSLIVGELIPKRLALTHPEAIVTVIARPMDILATVARPIVHILSASTDGILRLVGVRQTKQPGVTVGELPLEPGEEPAIVRRADGSWLLDGALDLDPVRRTLEAESLLSDVDRQHYHTLGRLAMLALGRVPRTGDVFERGNYRFEIVDMDGNRVDRVLAGRI